MSKILDIKVKVPRSASKNAVEIAASKAREAAIVSLQQQGELTIREAAAELGLSYNEYLELLNQLHLPASNTEHNDVLVEQLVEQTKGR